MLSRRACLTAWLAPAALRAASSGLKIGVMDGILGRASKPESMELAKRLGFDGLQVTLGRETPSGHLALWDSGLQESFLAESTRHKLPLVATYIDILHASCLKSDPAAVKWGVEGIGITRKLGAKILMLVFFGKCALASREEMDAVVAPLKELAAEAAKAGVTLGFENTILADDDLRILDQVGSPSLKIYYDIGNATNLYGADPGREIRRLGRERICQFHFKDKGYLGTGQVDVRAAVESIHAIGWKGFIVLETGSPSKDVEADLRRNLAYVRRVAG